ncbi:hypothetical protein ACRAWF_10025 [Streptomyces sp. L7]
MIPRLARTVPTARWADLRPLAERADTRRVLRGAGRPTPSPTGPSTAQSSPSPATNSSSSLAEDLHRRTQWPPAVGPATRGRADLVADAAEHLALVEALGAGEWDVAQSLVREHFAGAE